MRPRRTEATTYQKCSRTRGVTGLIKGRDCDTGSGRGPSNFCAAIPSEIPFGKCLATPLLYLLYSYKLLSTQL